MTKVLIIQSVLPEYRVPVFNRIGEVCDLTVMVPEEPKIFSKTIFNVSVIPEKHIKHLGRYFSCSFAETVNRYNVCISPLSINYPQMMFYLCGHKKTKIILWGIGVSAGYNVAYDSNKNYRKVLKYLINRADAALFYSSYPINIYKRMGINEEKMFVANNTVLVKPKKIRNPKYLLFVGSLYPAKGVDVLLKQYYAAFCECKEIDDLYIVGDGSERQKCEELCKENGLQEKVHFLGSIYNEDRLSELFAEAIVCISPNQAGLSVLKSMGYGVPFITSKESITGGERFNIINNTNGILYNNVIDLKDIIVDVHKNCGKYEILGKNAKVYYEKNRTLDNMVQGFLDSIKFVLS